MRKMLAGGFSPVGGGRRPRLWIPSNWRERDVVRQLWGRQSAHPGSRERSQSFWFPTTWPQLRAERDPVGFLQNISAFHLCQLLKWWTIQEKGQKTPLVCPHQSYEMFGQRLFSDHGRSRRSCPSHPPGKVTRLTFLVALIFGNIPWGTDFWILYNKIAKIRASKKGQKERLAWIRKPSPVIQC